jgi:hypothetical protein
MNKRKNRRGWIKVFEAVIALLLIIGVVLTLINRGYLLQEDYSEEMYELQITILREIEKDNAMRVEILSSPEIDSFSFEVPESIKEKINSRIPNYLECESKICPLNEICSLEEYPEKDVYAQSVAIAATPSLSDFSPRQLKIFCWMKE